MGTGIISNLFIDSKNIEIRNEVLKGEKKNIKDIPHKLDNELSKEIVFFNDFNLGRNKKALEDDFVYFHSSAEGKSKNKYFSSNIQV